MNSSALNSDIFTISLPVNAGTGQEHTDDIPVPEPGSGKYRKTQAWGYARRR